ncbi:MAG: 4-(cytidine 5'-diphospho)-2-C-methyl-D-erythritol kinase [Magnetococcales bacterium]|nr:4-(cytidine 5'-diphospho)-2-C-methyl-D-erythritol kinase [Magnetococcales bacterium]
MSLRFSAPAKVNLVLRVVGRRGDGYHLLETVMTFFPLFDYLEFAPAAEIELTTEPELGFPPEKNLVYRAACRLREEGGRSNGVRIHLEKRIPEGAGLGGGSSDAATALLVLNRLWGLHWPLERLLPLGQELGADVPFFLGGKAALAEGIGERLRPLPELPSFDLVLVNPGIALPTAAVFAELAGQLTNHPSPITIPSAGQVGGRPPVFLLNDLEAPALRLMPRLSELFAALRERGAEGVLMSGSGASVFGVYPGPREAEVAFWSLREAFPGWLVYLGRTFFEHPFLREGPGGVWGGPDLGGPGRGVPSF